MARIREKTLQFPGLNNVYTFADEADLFSASVPCEPGDYRIYNGDLYRCKAPHTGAWDASHFTLVKLGNEVNKLNKVAADALAVQEVSGAVAVAEYSAGLNAEDLVINVPYSSSPITGVDILSAGMNLLPMDRCVSAGYNISVGSTIDLTPTGKKWVGNNGVYTTDGTPGSWARDYGVCSPLLAKGQKYRIYFANPTGNPRVTIYILDSNNVITRQENRGNPLSESVNTERTLTGDECRIVIAFVGNSAPISVTTPNIRMLSDKGSAPKNFEIHEYAPSWAEEVTDFYGGTYDPVSGAIVSKYASDGTELDDPVSYSVDPIEVATAPGRITVMSSKGSIEKLVYKATSQSAFDAIDEKFDSIDLDIANIYTKEIDESKRYTSGDNFDYYPFDFVTGNDYVVKLKFNEYASTTERKYSLRTVSDRYPTAPYLCDWLAVVDNTDPEIGKEYVYRFTAGTDPSDRKANYLAVELNTNSVADADVVLYSIKAEKAQSDVDKLAYITAKDIVSLNHDLPYLIAQGNKPLNTATTYPLKLLHFSDIHGNQTNLERLVSLKNALGNTIEDTICTGDMAANQYSETCMDFWDAVDGSESILMVVGNHDLADGEHGYSSDQIGQTVAYEKYFEPYVSDQGVTMAGENLTYWYKDYASNKVRLIGLNYLLTGDALTAQNTWLAARLAEAKTNSYAVVIAEHTPPSDFTRVDCNFDAIGISWSYDEFPTSIQDVVKTFMDDDGEFACYIGGHAHCDHFGYNENYPSQLFVDITTAQTTGSNNDQYRANGNKSQDAANIFMVDTVTKTIKLIRVGADYDCYLRGRHVMSINYQTKAIIAES